MRNCRNWLPGLRRVARLLPDFDKIKAQYEDIVVDIKIVGMGTARKTRVMFKDGSYLDIWFSDSGRYSFNWERRHLDGKVFRFDNAPHHPEVKTFPHHLHKGTEEEIAESWIDPRPEYGVFDVLDFLRAEINR